MISLAAFPILLALVAQPAVTINISGLPEGAGGYVELITPSGNRTVTETTTIESAPAGTYQARPQPVRVAGPHIDTVYVAEPASATIEAGKGGSLTVTYRPRGGTGMLWVATERIHDEDSFDIGELRAFRLTDLQAGSIKEPTRKMQHGPRTATSVLLPNGDILVTDPWEGQFLRYPVSALASAGKPTTHKGEGLEYDVRMAVDPAGNLWLLHPNLLVRIDQNQLGNAQWKPRARYTPEMLGVEWFPGWPVFDADGNLYLVGVEILVLTPEQQRSGANTTPRKLELPPGGKQQAAFDKDGNLWVTDENSALYMVAKSALGGSGRVSAVEVSVPFAVQSIAFDNAGNLLFTVRYEGGQLYMRKADELQSGSNILLGQVPSVNYSNIILNPPPAWSPLSLPLGLK
ncbi:MAG: hypothetical protein ACK4P3_03665 [Fimbriimonadaceae bacterium]